MLYNGTTPNHIHLYDVADPGVWALALKSSAMRLHRRRILILSVIIVAVISFIWILRESVITSAPNETYRNFLLESKNFAPRDTICRRPKLDIDDPEISKFFTPNHPIECDSESDWVCVEPGRARLCNHTYQRYRDINCTYTFLKRQSDLSTIDGEVVHGGNQPVELVSDFFKVSCSTSEGTAWSNIMAGIKNDSTVHSRAGWHKLPPDALKLNVLIWGFDSLSRNTFMRKLPKTYAYMTDKLGAIVLKGYNIVGDGTPQALIPILTGQTEPELPETRKRMKNSQFVDVYPFVWKEYQSLGYVTAFTEDCPGMGTFTYRLKGFSVLPTDHYMRTFYIAAEKQFKNHKPMCLRNIPRHKVLMNWVRNFVDMYADKPKFAFTFHNELSHDDFNLVGSADDDLKEMIQNFNDEGHLNNTVLIIMSDHGHRFAKIREYQQGKQEERLPFFSFVFPPWFEKQHPQAMANFRKNANRLTTPFDIYPTLRDILHLKNDGNGSMKNRSISLFTEVPEGRTCEAADIEPHWCTCLDWQPVPIDDKNVQSAADAVVSFFNNLTEPLRNLCELLKLQKIVSAGKYSPSQNLLKFKGSKNYDSFEPDLSDSTKAVELYQVKIETKPGDGHFEASLTYDVSNNVFTVKEGDISRTNMYGKAAACVSLTQEQLRKFCYCKNNSAIMPP